MENVNVMLPAQKESSYPVYIDSGLLKNAFQHITRHTNAKRFLVVTNAKVYPLYGKYFESENVDFLILPDGESYKNIETLNQILNKALELKLERKDAIIALGGGVIGDMAGFAAAIYQRGIDFVQVPTTLLAQVDSSVGGKVAVNHSLGKNMIGAFYQPKLVLADTDTLNTLDERQFKTGLSEVLKYSFIEKSCAADEDYNFFEFLKKNKDKVFAKNNEVMTRLIKICCMLKSSVVNKDEKEKGLRAILNFGHTYAHAIENITHYEKYTHGEAVSIGMRLVFELALYTGTINEKLHDNALSLIDDYGLLTKLDFKPDKEEFYMAMHSDKKVSDKHINFVMPVGEKTVKILSGYDKNTLLRGI